VPTITGDPYLAAQSLVIYATVPRARVGVLQQASVAAF